MIATCPHCNSGFYISSEMAGAVVKCSKCKKEVRAPDRRGCAPGPLTQYNDGIPFAILAETRAEAEEHLKNETEARFDLEKRIKDAMDAKAKAEFQAQIDAKAKQEAEERLQKEVSARAEIEAKFATEADARKKAEESAIEAKQTIQSLEEKLKAETESRLKTDVYVETINMELTEIKAKLAQAEKALKDAQTNAAKEAEAKGQLEQRLQAETDEKIKAESQAKAEALAKKKYQMQAESETSVKIRLEQEIETLKDRIYQQKIVQSERKPVNVTKGLLRLTFILSLVAAFAGGYFAYINGDIIKCSFDRPIHISWFSQPLYIPRVLAIGAFGIGGFLIAWAAFLLAIFIIKGFCRQRPVKPKQIISPEPIAEETYIVGGSRGWRSS